jgi:hypothetical protein
MGSAVSVGCPAAIVSVRLCGRDRLFTRSMCGKKLWHMYCHSQEVEVGAFQLAVQLFLKEVLRMSEEDVAKLLTPANIDALGVAADSDGSGKVCAASSLGIAYRRVCNRAKREYVRIAPPPPPCPGCAGVGDGGHQAV